MAASSPSYESLFKLLVVGDASVGKTSIMLRYVDNTFSHSMLSTIGVDFKTRTITVNRRQVKLQIWDTAGHERFRTITNAFYRGAMGILLVYDITNRKSFTNISHWIKNITEQCAGGDEPAIIIAGNKCDLNERRVVSFEEGQEVATGHRVRCVETSAQSGQNIEEAFLYLAEQILREETRTVQDTRPDSQVVLSSPTKTGKKKCGCKG